MRIAHRKFGLLVVAFVALSFVPLLAGASAGDPEARFGSGVPLPLLAALSGMPDAALGWGGMARLELSPSAETPVIVGAGPILYVVERGRIDLRSDGSALIIPAGDTHARAVTLAGDDVTLGTGDRVLIAAGVSHAIRGSGTETSQVQAFAILPASATAELGFSNAGVTPVRALGIAMFMAAGDGSEPIAWPAGIVVITYPAVAIVGGSR